MSPPFPPGICPHGWAPPCCLDQAPPGEMWADGLPCSTSGLERSTVAMVLGPEQNICKSLRYFHNISTPTGRFLYEINIYWRLCSHLNPCSSLSVTDKRIFSRKVRFINISLSPVLFSMCSIVNPAEFTDLSQHVLLVLAVISMSVVNLMGLSQTQTFLTHKTLFGTLL